MRKKELGDGDLIYKNKRKENTNLSLVEEKREILNTFYLALEALNA